MRFALAVCERKNGAKSRHFSIRLKPSCAISFGLSLDPNCGSAKLAFMHTLIIEVSGGVVQEVYSDEDDLRVIKIDWDAGESPGDACAVGKLHVQPISALPDTTRGAFLTVRS